MNSKVIVTGAAGFIGSHLTEFLLKKGFDVVAIDNFHSYYSEELKRENLNKIKNTSKQTESDFRFVEGSILNQSDLSKLPENPYRVFHLAAVAGTRNSLGNEEEYKRINVEGTISLLNYFENIGKFVFTSSSSVYGEVPESELPMSEDMNCNPETPYSKSKIKAEEKIREYSSEKGFEHVILRPFSVFGPRQRPDEVFTKFLKKIIEGKPVEIYGEGTQSRDFTYVENVVEGIYISSEKLEGTFNLGKGRRVTVEEVVQKMSEISDKSVKKNYGNRHPGDVTHTQADMKKIEEEIGFTSDTELEKGIEETLKWLKGSIFKSKKYNEVSLN